MQNIFLTTCSAKFVVKFAVKILKIGWQIKNLPAKIFDRDFAIVA